MPLYEYDCRACGHRFELLIRGPQAIACPKCSSDSVDRLLSSFAVASEASRRSSLASARKRNAELNSNVDPDKPRTQIDHPYLH
jgi:putative FmdB family regulatory protein